MARTWSLALAAGLVAAINPCGFALLPAYLSYFLGLESKAGTGEDTESQLARNPILRALAVSGALTVGFVAVFAPMGIIWSSLSSTLGERIPWVTVFMGVALVGLGVAMLRGFQPTVRVPKLDVGATRRELWSMVLFGISYAVASLSCTLGPFSALVTSTFRRESFLTGIGAFVAYALGMGLLIAILTMSVAFTKQGFVTKLRQLLPHIGRISGGLVVVAGLFVAYYGWDEIRVNRGDRDAGGLVSRASAWQGRVSDWIQQIGAGWVAAVIGALIAAAVYWSIHRSRRTS